MYNLFSKQSLKKKFLKIMRLYILLSFIFAWNVSAGVFSQVVHFNENELEITIKDVLNIIENQTEYTFFYNDAFLDLNRPVKITQNKMEVGNLLNSIFKDTELTFFEQDNKFIVIVPKVLSMQGITIIGKVTDPDGEPMPGVNVFIKETRKGTITDINGAYSLTVPDENTVIVFSFIGFASVEMTVGNRQEINIRLTEVAREIEEIVVIGYGTQLKRDVTGAITSLTSRDIEQNSGADFNIALQGKVPGLSIITTSGEPGAGADITIRGASSINGSSAPLYIIDGVPIDAGNVSSLYSDASFSPISAINPNDIESIEVLKDAASAAIYGSRAANGVILITTKGGKNLTLSAPTVTVNHTSSIVSNIRNADVLNATQYREAFLEARLNQNPNYTGYPAWAINPYGPMYYRSTDWQDIMFKTRYQTVTDARVSGSSPSFAYSVSLGYRDLQPTIVYTNYKQINARGNFTYKISNFMKGGTTISFTQQDYRRVLTGSESLQSVISTIVKTNPCFHPNDAETNEITYWLGAHETRNPLALARDVGNNYGRKGMIISQYFDFTLAKNLTFRVMGSYDTSIYQQTMYTPRIFDNNNAIDVGIFQKVETIRLNNENYFNYSFISKDKRHSLSAMAGMSLQKNHSNTTKLDGQDYVDSKVTYIQAAARITTLHYTITENAMFSLYSRANYSYRSRYMASVTIRRDGSSRFGKDKRYGYFPSASLGWRFSDEPFMKWASKTLYDAKLRASWGVTGNQNIGNYAWQGIYSSGGTNYDGMNVVLFSNPMNSNLHWERTAQTNFGLDISFFKGRLSLTADVYDKTSDDLLFDFPIEYNTGFSSMPKNHGSIQNRGLEFMVETDNLKDKLVNWKTSFNITFIRSKVLSLPNNEDFTVGATLARVGEPVGVFYTHKALGIYAYDDDNLYTGPNTLAVEGKYRRGSQGGTPFVGGDVIWYDADNNGFIDDDDRVIVGDPSPNFTGGMSNMVSYKKFALSVFIQFVQGNDLMNDFRRDRNSFTLARNIGQDMLRRWQKQGDVTDRPRAVYSDPMLNFRQSSLWLENGSYVRLKDVSLSYTLKPNDSKFFFKTAKFTFTMNNVLTWSKYSGYDPEVNTASNPFVRGMDDGAFPRARSFNFGVNVTF